LRHQQKSPRALVRLVDQPHKAQLDLSRTVVRSPVNGYVTNLLTQLGDYANVAQKVISVVDADSFWIDGYLADCTRL
jgi:multidrug resistance efflux pump